MLAVYSSVEPEDGRNAWIGGGDDPAREKPMNPYREVDGRRVRVKFADFGKTSEVEGILDAHTYNHMIGIGAWVIGIDNVIEMTSKFIVPSDSFEGTAYSIDGDSAL